MKTFIDNQISFKIPINKFNFSPDFEKIPIILDDFENANFDQDDYHDIKRNFALLILKLFFP